MSEKPRLALDASLHAMQPLARWLMGHGVAYPAFAAAMKTVFLEAAQQELAQQGQAATDSALSLLSGVHRRDIRNMLRGAQQQPESQKAISVAAQVVALWLSDALYCDEHGQALPLPRTATQGSSFETLVTAVTTDIRPRAMLDELLRLGVVAEDGDRIRLLSDAFAPTKDFQAMAMLAQSNLHDHAAAAVANMSLNASANFLEQALFVDEISADSAAQLHERAARAWKTARSGVLKNAHQVFQQDQALPPEQRTQRVRFGVYFYSEDTAAAHRPEAQKKTKARRKTAETKEATKSTSRQTRP